MLIKWQIGMVMKSFCSKRGAFSDVGVLGKKYFCSSIVVMDKRVFRIIFHLRNRGCLGDSILHLREAPRPTLFVCDSLQIKTD